MIKQMQNLGLAVRWNDTPGSIARIARLGGVPVHACPKHLRPGRGLVAVVQRKGSIARLFECISIDGPRLVTLADGSIRKGYVLKARKNTLHSPGLGEPDRLSYRWHAVGQFGYFDIQKWRAVFVTDRPRDGEYLPEEDTDGLPPYHSPPRAPYNCGIPGRPRGAPESKLVDDYVRWIGEPERFEHHYLQSARLYTDLFDRSRWRLIEAKATTDRVVLRTAVGQLLDYRRFYLRHPAIAILLPQNPGKAGLAYLGACNVAAIWRTPAGRFSDSNRR